MCCTLLDYNSLNDDNVLLQNESNTLSFLMAMKEYHLYAESALVSIKAG